MLSIEPTSLLLSPSVQVKVLAAPPRGNRKRAARSEEAEEVDNDEEEAAADDGEGAEGKLLGGDCLQRPLL